MSDAQEFFSPATASDHVRPSPTSPDGVRPRPTMSSVRSEQHNLTTREVLQLFNEFGLPRNQRSIERYCDERKLDCFFDPDERRYYVTRASVDQLIGQLKEIAARHASTIMPSVSPTMSDVPRQAPPSSRQEAEVSEAAEKKMKAMEDEIFNLKVDNKAKETVITHFKNQMKDDRQSFLGHIDEISTRVADAHRQIGELTVQVKQLAAPKTPESLAAAHEPRVAEAEVVDMAAATRDIDEARDLSPHQPDAAPGMMPEPVGFP